MPRHATLRMLPTEPVPSHLLVCYRFCQRQDPAALQCVNGRRCLFIYAAGSVLEIDQDQRDALSRRAS